MTSRFKQILTVVAFSVALAACGGRADRAAEVRIRPVGNEMRFEQTEFTVRPGQQVRLVMENTATSIAMHHNIVVLNTTDGDVVNRVGLAALEAGEAADYIPQDASILAYTPMAAPGETTEVTFTAPMEPGTYLYICTYPGHYMMMQGTMTVTA
jgi:azurin